MSRTIQTHPPGTVTAGQLLATFPAEPSAVEPAPAPLPGEPVDWRAIAPTGWYALHGRRLFDLGLLVCLLPLATLPLVVVALANLLAYGDPWKVFFLQDRVGFRGEVFRIYKFRTMREVQLSHMDSWSNGGDSLRVTRLGRFLRNMHLDELPQLFNVFKGEMGFIGPRPEMLEIEDWANENVSGFTSRLRIRPGITGLAQITQGYVGRCADAYAEKLAISGRYLERMSFAFDCELVVRTAIWMVRGRGWRWRG